MSDKDMRNIYEYIYIISDYFKKIPGYQMQFLKYTKVSSEHMGLSSLYFTLIKISHFHKSRSGRTCSRTVYTEPKHLSYSYRWTYM
jgi:hypothetical protein